MRATWEAGDSLRTIDVQVGLPDALYPRASTPRRAALSSCLAVGCSAGHLQIKKLLEVLYY